MVIYEPKVIYGGLCILFFLGIFFTNRDWLRAISLVLMLLSLISIFKTLPAPGDLILNIAFLAGICFYAIIWRTGHIFDVATKLICILMAIFTALMVFGIQVV